MTRRSWKAVPKVVIHPKVCHDLAVSRLNNIAPLIGQRRRSLPLTLPHSCSSNCACPSLSLSPRQSAHIPPHLGSHLREIIVSLARQLSLVYERNTRKDWLAGCSLCICIVDIGYDSMCYIFIYLFSIYNKVVWHMPREGSLSLICVTRVHIPQHSLPNGLVIFSPNTAIVISPKYMIRILLISVLGFPWNAKGAPSVSLPQQGGILFSSPINILHACARFARI